MISEIIFALFHQKVYRGGFWEAYKDKRKIKEFRKYVLNEQDARHNLIKTMNKSATNVQDRLK